MIPAPKETRPLESETSKAMEVEAVKPSKVSQDILSSSNVFPEEFVVPFEVREDGSVKMQMKVSGKTKPTVVWLKDDTPLKPCANTFIEDVDDIHSLTIVKPTENDHGTYKCVAKSERGTSTRTFDFDVAGAKPSLPMVDYTKPGFLEDDSFVPFEVTEEGDLRLKVKVSGNPRPTIEWSKNNKLLRPERNIELEVEEDIYCLTIKKPTTNDEGTYRCKASSDTGTAVRTFEVDVEGLFSTAGSTLLSPHFVHDESIIPFSVTESGDIKLQAKFAGKPEPVIEWTKNGRALKPSSRIDIITEQGQHVVNIKKPTFRDEGSYKCTATNEAGTATRTFDVQMKGKKPVVPKETIPPQFLRDYRVVPFELTKDGNINMKVKVEGNPKPTVVWSKDGKTLKPSDHLHIHTSEDEHTLTVVKPTDADQGTYKCTATNKSGTATRTFEVDVEAVTSPVPESVVPTAVTPQQFTNVIHQGLNNFGEIVLQVKAAEEPGTKIEWFKNGKPVSQSSRLDIKRTRDDVYTLTIRSPKGEDEGLYTIKATNKSGISSTQSIEVELKGTGW